MKPESKFTLQLRTALIGLTLIFLIAIFIFSVGSGGSIGIFIGLMITLLLLIVITLIVLTTVKSANAYINQSQVTNNNASVDASAHDFVDYSVTYSLTRIGEQKFTSFLSNRDKGQFIINGRRITVGDFAFSANDIRWFTYSKQDYVATLDLNVDGWWYTLSIDPGYGGKKFIDALRKTLSRTLKKSNVMNREEIRTRNPIAADVNVPKTDGNYVKADTVELAITPLWLLVLKERRVINELSLADLSDLEIRKHPNVINEEVHLVTFTVDAPYAFALSDRDFMTHLIQVTNGTSHAEAKTHLKTLQASD